MAGCQKRIGVVYDLVKKQTVDEHIVLDSIGLVVAVGEKQGII